VKRDAVLVKVKTAGGLVGWGESHHGRAHTAVAKLIETTLKALVLGMDASDTVGVWSAIYTKQLGSHGMGAGTCLAMSGVDLALLGHPRQGRGAAAVQAARRIAQGHPRLRGWRVARLPGAGGAGRGDPAAPRRGYTAVKLRVGDSPLATSSASPQCAKPSATTW